ncbi:hypothetical protein [Streptosporangium roseum]|uniref:hypothetical protein n=1 Tax=Streptosporangium roseum TaxID=2001 RepID=UPI00331A5FE0
MAAALFVKVLISDSAQRHRSIGSTGPSWRPPGRPVGPLTGRPGGVYVTAGALLGTGIPLWPVNRAFTRHRRQETV